MTINELKALRNITKLTGNGHSFTAQTSYFPRTFDAPVHRVTIIFDANGAQMMHIDLLSDKPLNPIHAKAIAALSIA